MKVIKAGKLSHNILQIKKISKKVAQNLDLIDEKKIHLLFSKRSENFYEKNILEDLKRDIKTIKILWSEVEKGADLN